MITRSLLAAVLAAALLTSSASALDCTSQTSGDFDTVTWSCGVVPDADDTAIIGTGTEVTLDTNRSILGLVIQGGATFNQSFWTLTSVKTNDSFFDNNGTYNPGTGTFVFAQNGGVYGSSATTFRNVTIRGGVDFSGTTSTPQATVTSTLKIEAGGFVGDSPNGSGNGATPPVYGTFSFVTYDTGGSYGRGAEWTPSNGPGAVNVVNGTTLQLGSPGGTLSAPQGLTASGTVDMQAMSSPLDVRSAFIGSAGALVLSTANGGDLFVETSLTNNGTFTSNNRAVTFDGLVPVVGGANPVAFDFLILDSGQGLSISTDVSVEDSFTQTSGQVQIDAAHTFTSTPPSSLPGTTTSATVTGDAGWRMLSVPAASASTSEITDDGVGIRSGTATTSSILTGWSGTAYTTPASLPATLNAGEGFLLYFYDEAGAGELPITLDFDGATPAVADDPQVALNRGGMDTGWTMIGNPFRNAFDLNRLVGVDGYAPQVGQIWTDGAGTNAEGSFVLTTTLGDQIPVWQGAWVNVPGTTGAFAPTGAVFPDIVQVNGAGSFQSKAGAVPFTQLVLSGTDADTGATTRDEATLAVFSTSGHAGWDSRDAGKLIPPSAAYALLAFATEHTIDGETSVHLKAQESRELAVDGQLSLPVDFIAVGISGTFTVEPNLSAMPDGWGVVLEDLVTGAQADLRAGGYTFEATTTAAPGSTAEGAIAAAVPAGKADADARFVLHVGPAARVVAGEGRPSAATALGAVRPNPTVGVARASLVLDATERVRATVSDALGRTVREILDGELAGGASHELTIETAGLAPGVYVLRVEGETFAASQRLTVVR